jgi:cytochrome d ubiquinol oxidase subunit I
VPAASLVGTLALFVVVYGIVFAMGIYYINRLIEHGPQGRAVEPPGAGLPSRPLSAAADAAHEVFTASGRART